MTTPSLCPLTLFSQHKVLKDKMKRLREDLGCRMKPQREPPMQSTSPWDCLLDEVSHIASNVKTQKSQNRIHRQLMASSIRKEWDHRLHRHFHDKYAQRSECMSSRINVNLALAQRVKTYWNDSFARFDDLKRIVIEEAAPTVSPKTFLDGIINVDLSDIAHSSSVPLYLSMNPFNPMHGAKSHLNFENVS